MERIAPGPEVPPSRRTRILVRGLVVITLGILATAGLGQVVTYLYDALSTESRLRAEDDAQKQLDKEEAPFTTATDPDISVLDGDDWTLVLDRTITPAEQREPAALDIAAPDAPTGTDRHRQAPTGTDPMVTGGDWTAPWIRLEQSPRA